MKVLLLMTLVALAGSASAQESASSYFGNIEAPCHPARGGKEVCDQLLRDLKALAQCTNIDEPCPPAERILRALFGGTYRDVLPDFLVYFEQGTPVARGRNYEDKTATVTDFKAHRPVLMWRGRNTPHLYGARDLYMVVFSERPVCIQGSVTTEFKSEPNPFAFILTVLGKSFETAKAKDAERARPEFVWHPLDGDSRSSGLWWAIARADVEANSTNRATVYFQEPPKKEAPSGDNKKPAAKPAARDECVVADDSKLAAYTGDYVAANAFFSNSPDSFVTVALALGITHNVRGTSLGPGGSNQSLNAHALAKFYAVRPRVNAGPRGTGHRLSFGGVVGTNINGTAFDQILLGAAVGHIVGNVGLVIGANSIKDIPEGTDGRKWRPFFGVDYSF
jgi:hypothetical protein